MNFRICRAKESDLMDIFNLSNDPIVRKNSCNQHTIRLEDHIKWFNDKIRDENCIFYIVRSCERDFIGQVRFDEIKQKSAVYLLNISLSVGYRGKGLGYNILEQASNKLIEGFKVKKIVAYVKTFNVASAKIFKKAGYKQKGKQIERGVEVLKFECTK